MGIDTDDKINGTWIANANLDPRTWTRSYSAMGYFLPAQDRPNLTVIQDHYLRCFSDSRFSPKPRSLEFYLMTQSLAKS